MKIIFALASLLALSACTASGSIGPDYGHGYHDHGNGNFCPPGQAKKGRC